MRGLLVAMMSGDGNSVRDPADECADRNLDTNEFTGCVRRKECEHTELPSVRSRPVKEPRCAGRDKLRLRERRANPLEKLGVGRVGRLLRLYGWAHRTDENAQDTDRADEAKAVCHEQMARPFYSLTGLASGV